MSDSDGEDGIFSVKRKAMQMKFKDANKEAVVLSAVEKESETKENKVESCDDIIASNPVEQVQEKCDESSGTTFNKTRELSIDVIDLSDEELSNNNGAKSLFDDTLNELLYVDGDGSSVLQTSIVEVERQDTSNGVVTCSRRGRGRGSPKGRGRGQGRGRGRGRGRGKGRGRGRKSDVDMDSILRQLDEEELMSNLHSTSYVEDSVDEIVESLDMEVKFMFRGEVKRIVIGKEEKVYAKVDELAEIFRISDPLRITICFHNKILPLDSTPKSLELTVADILDCLVSQQDLNKQKVIANPNEIKVTFRDSNCVRSTGTELIIANNEKLLKIMQAYSEIKKLDFKNLIFEFDGEKLSGNETPEDLDMESGSLIDVRFKN